MEIQLVKSRYKITQVLRAGKDFAAFLAVDIESRDHTEYLLNVYEGAAGKRYVGRFESLRHCPEYVGMFTSDGALVSVFSYKQAENIDEFFYRGAKVSWRRRLDFAQQLFHLALSVWEYPPEISCAAFLTENLRLLPHDNKLFVNYLLPPMDSMDSLDSLAGMNNRELLYLLSDQVQKVLMRRFQMCAAELDFLEELESGVFTSITVLYSAWQKLERELSAEYAKVFAMAEPMRTIYFASGHVKRWVKRRFSRTGRVKR